MSTLISREGTWAYLKSRPEWRKVAKDPEYHLSVNLLKGTEENYRWLGVDWPENRYLLIGLSGDADIKSRKPQQTGVVNDWRCRYDLQTGKFDVPLLFSDHNAKAVGSRPPVPPNRRAHKISRASSFRLLIAKH